MTTPPTITPLQVAELLVEGERWPVCVHVIDHPDGRVLVDTGMTEPRQEVADMDPRLVPLSEHALDLVDRLVAYARRVDPLADRVTVLAAGAGRRERSREMTRYLISFPSGAMDHIPAEDFPAVGEAAHAVVQEAMDAGVWVFGGGLAEDVDPVMVVGDGTITAGTYPQTEGLNGGFTILDVPSREAAVKWAAKLAVACRCAQEIREFMPDPAVGN